MKPPRRLIVAVFFILAVLAIGGTVAGEEARGVTWTQDVLTWQQTDVTKGLLAAGGMLLLAWEAWARRRHSHDSDHCRRRAVLIVLGLVAALGWGDLVGLGFGGVFHRWDTFHYYVGGKYFRELGYTRLYLCTTIADAEDGIVADLGHRLIRDLETNRLIRADHILADPGICTEHFTPDRWRQFKRDVWWFRERFTVARWERVFRDHGFNGSPAWLILGSGLANLSPASAVQIRFLTLIDPFLLLAMWTLAWWAFGGPATCIALVYWGTNFPADFGWTGGAYLRQDWLFATVAGIALLRRGRPTAAGAALGTAAMLRVFPVMALLGLAIKAGFVMWRERRLAPAPEYRRLALGALGAIALLVAVSSPSAGGWRAWSDFTRHIFNYSGTVMTNLVGLKMIVAYDHDTRVSRTADLRLEDDAFQVWRAARDRILHERRYLLALLVAAMTLLTGYAIRTQADWPAAVLGIGLIPIMTAPLSYYFSVLLVFGFLGWRRPFVGAALCGLAALSRAIPFVVSGMDVRSAALSVQIVAFVVLATAVLARWPRERSEDAAPGRLLQAT